MPTYTFEEAALTCVALEQELGLNRGDITELVIYPEGAVVIETSKALTAAKQTSLKASLAKRGLPRGQRPIGQ